MITVALRGVRAHLVRFALAVLAVMLGVAFVAGTFSLRTLLGDTFDGIVDGSMTASAYVRGADEVSGTDAVTGEGGTVHGPVPASLAAEIADVDGVQDAFADVMGTAVLVGADGTAVTTTGAPVLAMGLNPDDPTLGLVSGALPEKDDEIALETFALDRSGLAVGDRTRMIVNGEIREVTVTAELSFDTAAAGAILIGLDAQSAAADFAPDGTVSTVSVIAADGVTEEQVRDSIADFLAAHPTLDGATTAEVVTGETAREETRESISSMLGFIQVFLLAFAAVSLFVGGFLITNTFAMSVRERMREFAMLRALGASPAQVFASILVQALVIGLLGSLLGIAAGIGLATGLGSVLDAMGMPLSGSVGLSAETVVVALVIGLVMSLVAAAIPARRAALTPPVVAMHGDLPATRRLRWRTVAGTALTGIGVAAVVYAALGRDAAGEVVDGAGGMLGAGAVVLLVGALVLAPALARGAIGVLAAPFVAWGRPLGALARGNVVRNPRRTASTAGALMIGMTLVSASSVLAASASSSVDSIVRSEMRADLIVQSAAGALPQDMADEIVADASSGLVDPLTYGTLPVDGVATPVGTAGALPTMFERSLDIAVTDGDIDAFSSGEVIVSKSAAKANGWAVGDMLELGSPAETVRVGTVTDSPFLGTDLIVPSDVLDRLAPDTETVGLLVTAADGFTLEDLRADVTAAAAPYLVIAVLDQDELVDDLSGQIEGMLAVIYALLALSVIIAVLGIVNTLALSIIERTREVALLRAVGLGRLQLSTMVAIESVLIALFGTVLGVAIGVGIASALPTVFADMGLTTLVVPWAQLGFMVGLAAVIGLVASVWPAIRAARLPVLDGLAAE